MLLGRSSRVPESFSALPWTTHPDARVRVEAIRLQLTLPYEETWVFTPPSTTSIRASSMRALTAIGDDCPPDLLGRVIELAQAPPGSDENIRLTAVAALAHVRHPRALDSLLQIADGGRSLLGRQKLPPKSPALLDRDAGARWILVGRSPGCCCPGGGGALTDPEIRKAGGVSAR